jgi:hypothetical protein
MPAAGLAQSDFTAGTSPGNIRFKRLWSSQTYLNIGILGYREVSETDLFTVRSYNPSGPDIVTQQVYHPVTQQGYYPLLTIGGAYHRNLPLITKKHIRLHLEVMAGGVLQRIVAPSLFSNTYTSSDHYTIGYHQMPSLTMIEASAGLWIGELVSVGYSIQGLRYTLNTNDDRVQQKHHHFGRVFNHHYVACWIPLEKTAMKRWVLRGNVYLALIDEQPARIPKAELMLIRLSKEKSGRTFGLFARYLTLGEFEDLQQFPDFKIHHDKQFIMGLTIGAGGLNRRGGR